MFIHWALLDEVALSMDPRSQTAPVNLQHLGDEKEKFPNFRNPIVR